MASNGLVCAGQVGYSIYANATTPKGFQGQMTGVSLPARRAEDKHAVRDSAASRVLRSLLIGLAIALLLSGIEIGLLWLVMLATNGSVHGALRFQAALASLSHDPYQWLALLPFVEWAAAALLMFKAMYPLALRRYRRGVQSELEDYRATATSLAVLTDPYASTVTYHCLATATDPSQTVQTLSLLELTRKQGASFLLVGPSGAGKTLALHLYQQMALLESRQRAIPLFISLREYGLYLKAHGLAQPDGSSEDASTTPLALVDFLLQMQQASVRNLQPYLRKLLERGQLLLLCDGLDEVDRAVRPLIARELAELHLMTENKVIIACRELDYRDQHALLKLIDDALIDLAVIEPLQAEQVRDFVEQYIESQGNQWRHTAGQIMQTIDQSRLRSLCTNPLLLFCFLAIIDRIGIQRGQTLDTRGLLLQAYVAHVLKQDASSSKTSVQGKPADIGSVAWLGSVAYDSRVAGNVDTVLIPANRPAALGEVTLANEVRSWLAQRQRSETLPVPREEAATPQRIEKAGLLDITSIPDNGNEPATILCFRHPLLADYCIAAYLLAKSLDRQGEFDPVFLTIFEHIEDWCVALALWAGLADDPLQLAGQVVLWGRLDAEVPTLPLLLTSLICAGVAWKSPVMGDQRVQSIPPEVAALLAETLADQAARQDFARLFTRCVEEGAHELLYAALALVNVEGVEALFALLDRSALCDLLFSHLCDIADLPAYDTEIRQVCRILWSFGALVIPQADALSRPGLGGSLRLRTAAVNILGGTRDASAVEPLIERLDDREQFIVQRAIYALSRLGPEMALPALVEALEMRLSGASIIQVHLHILTILERFLQAHMPTPHSELYQRVLQAVLAVLSVDYAVEPAVQLQARMILLRQCEQAQQDHAHLSDFARQEVVETIVTALLPFLDSGDDVMARNVAQALREIGPIAIPFLVIALTRQPPLTEMARARLIELLRDIQAPDALPVLLDCVGDPSPLVQQQITGALRAYVPESIPGLIDLVLSAADVQVAERAAQILSSIGGEAIDAITRALVPIVASRTRLLVTVLGQTGDPQVLPPLINLLRAMRGMDMTQEGVTSPDFILLSVTVIRVLGQFSNRQVVPPLIRALSFQQVQLYEEAIDALSHLGMIAFDDLLVALDVSEETVIAARVRRILLGMTPFPGAALVEAWRNCTAAQARQIMLILEAQGSEAAYLLVRSLFHQDNRVRQYASRTILEMPGAVVVPPLIEALDQRDERTVIIPILLKYEEAIPPLVDLLSDVDRSDVAAGILQRFGPEMLTPLISALDNEDITVQEYAQHILVSFVRRNPAHISLIVGLFGSPLPLRGRDAILEVLTTDLAGMSIPALLEGLEDAHLIADVAEALTLLARKSEWQSVVIASLIDALRMEERRRGAETALISIGASVVESVGALLTDEDQRVAAAAQRILREIGAPALPYIWAAHNDTTNPARRAAARSVFQSMPTDDIKQALVELLGSHRSQDMALALALLTERIHDEQELPLASQEMIPALLDYIEIHEREPASLRTLSLLFLLGGDTVTQQFARTLYDRPEHHEMLAYAFLFLGEGAKDALQKILDDPNAGTELRSEAMAVLGLLQPTPDVVNYAQSLNRYGLTGQATIASPEQLSVALRALGSLLASGQWDVPTLQSLRRSSIQGSPQEELFSALLGWRNAPELANLRQSIQLERESHKSELVNLTSRLIENQARIKDLTSSLQQVQYEHGQRGDELDKIALDREYIRDQLDRVTQEKDELQDQVAQLQAYNEQILRELERFHSVEGE
jgi:HEAT repeat protein